MSFIHNLLMGAIHLLCVAMDLLVIMILIIGAYHRWQPKWLRQLYHTIKPLMVPVVAFAYRATQRITGKSLPEHHLFLIIIATLWVTRLMMAGLINH